MTNQPAEGTFSRLMAGTPPTGEKPREEQPLLPPGKEAPREKQVHARTGVRKHAPMHARMHTPTDALVHAELEEELYRRLQSKQRLASSTFRFRPEELEELDEVFKKLEQKNPRKVSKNDLVRLGLNWLLADYRAHGEESLLERTLAHS
jgi:hypothetical protein